MTIKTTLRGILPARAYGALRALRRWRPVPGLVDWVLVHGRPVPSMITPQERRFFAEAARAHAGRGGAIVDLGCWFGSTAIALARGLRAAGVDAGDPGGRVLAYDLFTWQDWMPRSGPYGLYEVGESFLPEARRVVRDHAGDRVAVAQADLSRFAWDGRPIRLLLVDAMKGAELARQIARTFYPRLQPGGLLIHQDYKHYFTSWIHVVQARLRDRFRLVRSVPRSGTAAFEVTSAVPAEEAERAGDFAGMTDAEVDACFAYSLGLFGPDERSAVAAAHVTPYSHLGRFDRADALVESYRSGGLAGSFEFDQALGWLAWSRQAPSPA